MESKSLYLTKENVVELMRKHLKGAALCYETLMDISFYMDFAIGTKDIALIEKVHFEATSYCLGLKYPFS